MHRVVEEENAVFEYMRNNKGGLLEKKIQRNHESQPKPILLPMRRRQKRNSSKMRGCPIDPLPSTIRSRFEQIQKIGARQMEKRIKQNQIETLGMDEKMQSMLSDIIFKETSIDNVRVKLVEVKTEKHMKMFNMVGNLTSSMPQYKIPGCISRILVMDTTSKSILGILQFTVDTLNSPAKWKYLDIPIKLKRRIRRHGANMTTCVPVQPFGFNFCGGKLLAMLAFSNECYNILYNQTKRPIATILTTSIHGKSIQYSRLKQLKYIGLTEGFGTGHIPQYLVDMCAEFARDKGFKVKRASKYTLLRYVLRQIGLGENHLHHGIRRGIYMGVTSSSSISFLKQDTSEIKLDKLGYAEEITEFWKSRWARRRYENVTRKVKEGNSAVQSK